MRIVLQRVRSARAELDGEVVASVGSGLVAFVGVGRDDDRSDAEWMASKIANLRNTFFEFSLRSS